MFVAHEVAHIVDEFGGSIHLKQTPIEEPKSTPILDQAQHMASNVVHSALDTGKSLLSSATAVTNAAVDAVTNATNRVVDTATSIARDAAASATSAVDSATHAAKDAAFSATSAASAAVDSATHVAKDAAASVTHTAQGAVHHASDLAGAVTLKTRKFGQAAANKGRAIADNISHFTTLITVLAEEENERARRMVSGDEARAAANAFRISELIRDLDIAFYKQTPNLTYATKVLEEAERRWRLNSGSSSLAESNAHNVGKLVSNNLKSFMPRYQWVHLHITGIEEKERTRRLNDSTEIYAIINALNLSFIIRELGLGFYRQEGCFSKAHASYATTLLEENERKNRIRTEKIFHADDSARLMMDVVSNNIEKFNYSTRNATRVANALFQHVRSYVHTVKPVLGETLHEFASLLANATIRAANTFSSMSRDLAKNTAQRVRTMASDISNYTSVMYLTAIEEKERARRLADPSEILAINNAWEQSGLIRELWALYRPSSMARFPLRTIEEHERRWRLSHVTPSASRQVAAIVFANRGRFESVAESCAKICHAKDVATHSRLNPNAPSFVPHIALPTKVESAITRPSNLASGAQL